MATIKELKTKLTSISKDAHFTEAMLDELVALVKAESVEPTELNVGKKIDEFKGETFTIVKTDRGCLYHEYGGYYIFVNPTQTALYSTLVDYVENKDTYFELTGDEKDVFDLNMSAIAYCLSVPKFCFADVEFTYEIATKVIEFLRKVYEKSIDAPLQEETIEQDAEFEQASMALEDIKSVVNEAKKEIDD